MVTFALSGHRRLIRFAVHGAALALWATVEIHLIAARASAAFVAAWTVVGALLLWNAVRRGAGRETLTVTPRFLEIRRRVGPFRFTRRYEMDCLADVRMVRLPGPGRDRYRIEFLCAGRARRFGRNLSAQEASCVVHLIRGSDGFLRRPA
jgi:hypothetical protein